MAQKPNKSLTPPTSSSPNVAFIRREIVELSDTYNIIRDVISGSKAVKKHTVKYLPMPNAVDQSPENKSRYQSYLDRAVFYNVAKRTLSGLVGQIFLRDPVVELPPVMDILKGDLSGSGITADQCALMLAHHDLAYGRVGVLVDYPDVDAPATLNQIRKGEVRPAVLMYDAWEIINWRYTVVNGKTILSLVVLHENAIDIDDGFEQTFKDQWRVLWLNAAGQYQVDLYEVAEGSGFAVTETYFPKDSKGVSLTEIPFTFIGVTNNDGNPDDPPIYDIVELNLAHFRNSADYEESCFLCGQPQIFLAGLTEDWVKNVLKGTVDLGSRAAVPLPIGGSVELIQAQANMLVKEAMDQKERQMVALGAKLVEQKSVQRTLGEAELENTAEISILASIAKNVEIAMTFALVWCARFVGADEKGIKYELNTEFDLTQLDAQERQQTQSEWKAGQISFSEMRQALRRAGVASLPDDKVKAELKQDKTDGVAPVDPKSLVPENKPGEPVPPQPNAQ